MHSQYSKNINISELIEQIFYCFFTRRPLFSHFEILTKRKIPHSAQPLQFINHTSPLGLSCSACWLAQLKYQDCVLGCSQATEVSEQSFPSQPAGALAP